MVVVPAPPPGAVSAAEDGMVEVNGTTRIPMAGAAPTVPARAAPCAPLAPPPPPSGTLLPPLVLVLFTTPPGAVAADVAVVSDVSGTVSVVGPNADVDNGWIGSGTKRVAPVGINGVGMTTDVCINGVPVPVALPPPLPLQLLPPLAEEYGGGGGGGGGGSGGGGSGGGGKGRARGGGGSGAGAMATGFLRSVRDDADARCLGILF